MATVAPPAPRPAGGRRPGRLRALSELPNWAIASGLLVVLVAVSAYVRTRALSGQFWIDEAISTGIAANSRRTTKGSTPLMAAACVSVESRDTVRSE